MRSTRTDRSRFEVLVVVGLACLMAAAVGAIRVAGSSGDARLAAPTTVKVTAGKPSEYAFKLSRSSSLPWNASSRSAVVTFAVTNAGAVAHGFKVCTLPLEGALANSCRGKATATLKPGRSAALSVTFTARGVYEYLSPVPGQAAKGMKGAIGIGIALPKATTPGTTTPTTPSTPSSPSTPSTPSTPPTPPATGETSAGAAVWTSAGCGGCHSIGEVKGNVGPDLNLTHPGPFANGPLTPTQISELVAYINSR